MGEALIIQRLEAFEAFITVTYPSGTCTVTGEGQTYIHTGGGTKTFTVNKKGTYTVSGVDSAGGTGSTNVSITKNKQNSTVTLKYTLTLFDNGVANGITWTTSGKASSVTNNIYFHGWCYYGANQSNPSVPIGHASTVNAINLTAYKNLYFTVSEAKCTGTYSGYNYVRVGVGSGNGTSLSTYVVVCGPGSSVSNKTFSVDVSSYGSTYIKGTCQANDYGISGSAATHIRITKIWATS